MAKFDGYLSKVGITATLKARVELAHRVASQICPEEIEDILVSDYVQDDGTRVYESIWFFSKGYCMEAHNFITENAVDIVPIRAKRVAVSLKDYDFRKATEKSRLQVVVLFGESLEAEIKAAKENCDVLRDIVFKYFRPRFAE